jgi:hypothetical protein
MRSDQLIVATRRAAFIPDAHSEYTDAVVLDELNRTMSNVFVKPVTTARSGFWVKTKNVPSVALRARYRLPARACGIEAARWGDTTGRFTPLTLATAAEVPIVQGDANSNIAIPRQYDIAGDQLVMLPAPTAAGYTLQMEYYLRPSRFVPQQSTTLGGGTVRGQITAVDTVARTITVNALPFDEELGTPAAITSAVQQIDVVHPSGWYEVALVGATQTIAALVITVGGTDTMQDIEVGDFVRAAEQTDWPALADEWHQTLCDATAVRIMLALGMTSKAGALAQKIGLTEEGERKRGTDLARFMETLEPRIKNSPKVVARRSGIIYGRPYSWWPR